MQRLLPAILLLISPCLAAQDPSEGSEQKRKRIDARIKQMREAIREGRPITTNVRVTVRLRNQYRMSGVVKNGRFVEKLNGLDFVDSNLKTPGAGIRVWYSDNTISYVFLPFEEISSYKIGARLTQVEIEEIEDRIAKRKEAEDARKIAKNREQDESNADTRDESPTRQPTSPAVTRAARRTTETPTGGDETQEFALLEEFPPDQGWGEERLREIERRKVVIGAFPDEKEERFLQVFGKWQEQKRQRDEQEAPKPLQGPRTGLPAKPGDPTPGK